MFAITYTVSLLLKISNRSGLEPSSAFVGRNGRVYTAVRWKAQELHINTLRGREDRQVFNDIGQKILGMSRQRLQMPKDIASGILAFYQCESAILLAICSITRFESVCQGLKLP